MQAMETLVSVILVLAGIYVGWNIGANDAANCIGTTVGAQVMPYRRAVALMAVFVVLGGMAHGENVMETVGHGIVIADAGDWVKAHGAAPPADFAAHFPSGRLPDAAILAALLSAGLFVTLATFTRVPVSTSQAIVGAVAGTGVALVGLDGRYFRLDVLGEIAVAWVASPVLTMLLSFAFYRALGRWLRGHVTLYARRGLGFAVMASAAYVSFSLGANDVGNAIGPLYARFPDAALALAVLGGGAMAVGAWTFGARVTQTVGKDITSLDYAGALAAQFAAARGVHLFSLAGIPVSTSQAVVGGVAGVGLTRGFAAVRGRRLATIFVGWVVTPLTSALIAILMFKTLGRWLPAV